MIWAPSLDTNSNSKHIKPQNPMQAPNPPKEREKVGGKPAVIYCLDLSFSPSRTPTQSPNQFPYAPTQTTPHTPLNSPPHPPADKHTPSGERGVDCLLSPYQKAPPSREREG